MIVDQYQDIIDLERCEFRLTWYGLAENSDGISLKLLGAKPLRDFCNIILRGDLIIM